MVVDLFRIRPVNVELRVRPNLHWAFARGRSVCRDGDRVRFNQTPATCEQRDHSKNAYAQYGRGKTVDNFLLFVTP